MDLFYHTGAFFVRADKGKPTGKILAHVFDAVGLAVSVFSVCRNIKACKIVFAHPTSFGGKKMGDAKAVKKA